MRWTICAIGTLAFTHLALAAEHKVSLDQLPQPVQTAIAQHTLDATIKDIVQEGKGDRVQYEVETDLHGRSHDLIFSAKGDLLESEDEVDIDSIPTPAKAALARKAAGGNIQKVEKLVTSHGSQTYYEAAISNPNGKTTEFTVDPNGSPRNKHESDAD
jgi:uncharacterized membrane protein YkoI